ncbi:hypothetical protein M501DRAFT_212853 [Patellaria atrata CBS 101060]|uniref:Uncharacterized protein n=1 Tax=Patellaria atrata CBS 101060 TaxID=1346257 RepID=A0A9P4S6H8_9PEZI|nr:hypothetical protein M501DRAFT_212853 [Patellaria atrata CBS 101060]
MGMGWDCFVEDGLIPELKVLERERRTRVVSEDRYSGWEGYIKGCLRRYLAQRQHHAYHQPSADQLVTMLFSTLKVLALSLLVSSAFAAPHDVAAQNSTLVDADLEARQVEACRPVGLRVFQNDRCILGTCTPTGNCFYSPCHQITVFKRDGSIYNSQQYPAKAPFEYGYQKDIGGGYTYFGKKNGDPDGLGMSVSSSSCGGIGCQNNAVRPTTRSAPGVIRRYYDCGQTPEVP